MNKKTVLLILCAAVLATGCTVAGYAKRVTHNVAQTHDVNVNSIVVYHDKLLSFGRLRGDGDRRIRKTVELARLPLGERGRVRFLMPAEEVMDDVVALQEFLYQGAENFLRSFDRAVGQHMVVWGRPLELDVVMSAQSGVYYTSTVPIHDVLRISLLKEQPSLKDPEGARAIYWWMNLSSTATHEFFHLHRNLKSERKDQAEEETAAHLIGTCASDHYLRLIGSSQVVKIFDPIDELNVPEYFPALSEGSLVPDLPRLESLRHNTLQGYVMAQAVRFLLAGKEELHPIHDREIFERIADYCDTLLDEIPRYKRGEW